jgi:nucleotide-binding universal stress UspA family protein
MIRRIVAGVATPRPDDPALVAGLRLSARLGAELDLVHVDTGETVSRVPHSPAVLRAMVERVEPGANATGRIVCRALAGTADRRLLEVAEETGADLLVLGATRRGTLAGALLGTTAGRVLRGARTPVLVVREPLPERPMRVLLTTDLSRHAAYAHSRGGALARSLCAAGAAEVRSLYVQPPRLPDEPVSRAEVDAEAERELIAFLRAEVPAASAVPRVRDGDPASEIVAEARDWGADLVVLGTHGRRGARRLFLGSVAETVLRHAPCATLVIPPLRSYRMDADHAHAGDPFPAPPKMAATT